MTGLIFDNKKCIGVKFTQKGKQHEIFAGKEIVLSGGAVNSPHILQVYGIGPQKHLQSIGVKIVHDLPGVGQIYKTIMYHE